MTFGTPTCKNVVLNYFLNIMKKNTAINYFGSNRKVAQALNISDAAITAWGEQIPELRARQLEEITQGALKFDRSPISSSPTEWAG